MTEQSTQLKDNSLNLLTDTANSENLPENT